MTFMVMRRCYQAINEQQCVNTVVCLYVWLHYSYGWICLISLWELWRNHVRQRTNKSTGPDLNAPILCVGDSVCAGVCADSDGGQSREQIQQSWPVRHLRYAEQWLCFRIPDRWGRHRTQTLMYTPHKLLRNRNVLYWSMCPPPPLSLSLPLPLCDFVFYSWCFVSEHISRIPSVHLSSRPGLPHAPQSHRLRSLWGAEVEAVQPSTAQHCWHCRSCSCTGIVHTFM